MIKTIFYIISLVTMLASLNTQACGKNSVKQFKAFATKTNSGESNRSGVFHVHLPIKIVERNRTLYLGRLSYPIDENSSQMITYENWNKYKGDYYSFIFSSNETDTSMVKFNGNYNILNLEGTGKLACINLKTFYLSELLENEAPPLKKVKEFNLNE